MNDASIDVMIVDDEPTAREGLRLLLAPDPSVSIAAESGDGRDAVAKINLFRPNLVFLDVQMPEMSGFEVLAQLEGPLPLVVFVTAYDKYAIAAFDSCAVDYLVKPFTDERFFAALARAKRQIRLERVSEASKRLAALLENEDGGRSNEGGKVDRAPPPSRLAIKSSGRVVFLDTEEIRWIEATDYYVTIHTGSESYLHRESMSSLERRLEPTRFIRVHRGAIVRRACIKQVVRAPHRRLAVVLDDGTEIGVSRGFRERIQNLLSSP